MYIGKYIRMGASVSALLALGGVLAVGGVALADTLSPSTTATATTSNPSSRVWVSASSSVQNSDGTYTLHATSTGVPNPFFPPTYLTITAPGTVVPSFAGSSTAPSESATSSASAGTSAGVAPVAYPSAGTTPAPMVVNVAPDGSAVIRGTVATVGPTSITINTWGGVWTIAANGSATVLPPYGGSSVMAGFRVGDFVGADGYVSQSAPNLLDATVVRDWTTNP